MNPSKEVNNNKDSKSPIPNPNQGGQSVKPSKEDPSNQDSRSRNNPIERDKPTDGFPGVQK